MQSLAEIVNPGGTGRPRFAISASPAPLPPRMSRIAADPSARPPPKEYTQRTRAGMRGLHREGVERRRVPRACQILFGNLRGIVAREAGVTKLGPFAARRAEHPVEGQIPEGVYA